MQYKLKFGMTLLLVILMSAGGFANSSGIIYKAATMPVIDGLLDDVWNHAVMEHDGVVTEDPGNSLGFFDCGLAYRALYDDNYLYVFVTVVDDTLNSNRSQAWHEVVEFYLDGNNSKLPDGEFDADDIHFNFQYDAAAPGHISIVKNLYSTEAYTGEPKYMAALTDLGFDLEIAIPLGPLDMSPAAGDSIGFEIVYNDMDQDNIHDTKLSMFGLVDPIWKHTANLGTAVLSDITAYDRLDVYETAAPIVVDGADDGEWDAFPLRSSNQFLKMSKGNNFPNGWMSNSFDFKAAWDTTALYLIVYMTQDTLVRDRADAGSPWDDTAIEIWLDADNAKLGGSGWNTKDSNDVGIFWSYDPESIIDTTVYSTGWVVSDSTFIANMQRGGTVTEDGTLIFETALPLTDLYKPVEMTNGTVIGLQIDTPDNFGGKANYYGTDEQPHHSHNWGTAMLIGSDQVPEIPDVQPVKTIAIAQTAPLIDGLADPVWKNSKMERDGVVVEDPGVSTGFHDCGLAYRALYDEENLYLLVSVFDDTLNANRDKPWKEAVEFYLDANNSKLPSGENDADDIHFNFQYDGSEAVVAIVKNLYSTSDETQIEYAAVLTDLGFDLEIAIPFEPLGVSPAAGDMMGFEVVYNDMDQDGIHDTKISMFGIDSGITAIWNNTSNLATVMLDDRLVYPFLDVWETGVALTIDGVEDAEWQGFPLMSSNQWAAKPEVVDGGWEDHSFEFRTAWDADYLYMIVYAMHDTLIENRTEAQAEQYWNDTSLEVWLDTDNSKGFESKDDNDVNFGFTYDAVTVVDSSIGGNIDSTAKANMLRAGSLTEEGVMFELAIPLTDVVDPVVMEHGSFFGFDIGSIEDDDGVDSKATFWALNSNIWKDPSQWGTAVLMNEDVDPDTLFGTTAVGPAAALPNQFSLEQNYPNPFNPVTSIVYALPKAGDVKLTVFNMLGQQVATLVDKKMAAGRHTVQFDASAVASGMYIYHLQAGGKVLSRKLLLLK